ncbi:uncharacterized protein LOC124531407 [Vanessa cardui]|uniref:uncharacterized protein LOC124531407 n=1 Tax=Vanessa cardui TaxID=171605 RepID=UPI001F12F7CE|nr:uncharacterized protein LOC124531407 [Vanessa cardui]
MNTIAIVLFAVVACASAAPRYHDHFHHHPYSHDGDVSLERFIEREIFDTRRFWEELRREMMGIDKMIADLNKNFGTFLSNEKIEGNQYKITISLNGFEEKEIAVKAKKRLLIVQAVHKGGDDGPERNYLDLRTLPDFVDINGSWTFENGVLTVVFPVERSVEGTEATITEVPVTQAPEHSREEVESNPTVEENQDADIGIERGDLGKDKNILTNEISSGQQSAVEATTYAVDLKDEVELVPIHRNIY